MPSLLTLLALMLALALPLPVAHAQSGTDSGKPRPGKSAAHAAPAHASGARPASRPAKARKETPPRAVRIIPSKMKSAPLHPATAAALAAASTGFADRAEAIAFAEELQTRHGLERENVLAWLGQARSRAEVLRLIAPAPTGFKRNWSAYRLRFLDPLRLREGARFLQIHEADFARAETQFGVPREIVAAILGVETVYGRITGDFRVIDALATLAFDYPPRAPYFREELEHFLVWTRDSGLDPLSVKGSFAGAIGLPQFMPGSILRHAMDFDGDGRIDLRASPVDAIGSVARFLAAHGWKRGETTHFGARFEDTSRVSWLIESGIEPRLTIAELRALGVASPDAIPESTLLALIDLPDGDNPPLYVLGAANFYAVTRYNRSSFYAMAVIELATALREGTGAVLTPSSPAPERR